jgi:hypothetical protein
MKTIIKNYEVKQFSTFLETIKILNDNRSPKDITSWAISGAMQGFYDSSKTAYIVCTKTNPLLGEFTIGLNNFTTSNIATGQYVYDISALVDPNTVYRLYSGTLTMTNGVTNLLDPDVPSSNDGNSFEQFIDGGIFYN